MQETDVSWTAAEQAAAEDRPSSAALADTTTTASAAATAATAASAASATAELGGDGNAAAAGAGVEHEIVHTLVGLVPLPGAIAGASSEQGSRKGGAKRREKPTVLAARSDGLVALIDPSDGSGVELLLLYYTLFYSTLLYFTMLCCAIRLGFNTRAIIEPSSILQTGQVWTLLSYYYTTRLVYLLFYD